MESLASEPPGEWSYTGLSSYRHCVDRICATWTSFRARRATRLRQGLFNAPVEKVAENIVEDLLTVVLDWALDDVNLQIGRADMVLSVLGIKRLVLELKRPGSLVWQRPAVSAALEQACRYAAAQHVNAVAISDGSLFYAADLRSGGLRDRLLVNLDAEQPPLDLWWLSAHGIYRERPDIGEIPELSALPGASAGETTIAIEPGTLVHPKYQLPAWCFAYVGSSDDTRTWKLPFLTAAGAPDGKRLPKAIQAVLSNYRGARVGIPRESVGAVLTRLAQAAAQLGKLPCQHTPTADAYREAHDALIQLGKLSEVHCCTGSFSG